MPATLLFLKEEIQFVTFRNFQWKYAKRWRKFIITNEEKNEFFKETRGSTIYKTFTERTRVFK